MYRHVLPVIYTTHTPIHPPCISLSQLVSGAAEIFGAELLCGRDVNVAGQKLAVRCWAWHGWD
jgi:hypothetical protein